MSKLTLTAQKRERVGKGAARTTRRAGLVPGVIYGDKKAPVTIALDPRDLIAELQKPGFAAHVYEIDVAGDKHRVVPRDVQFHPVTDLPIHADFMRISAKSVIHADVGVEFINEEESPGLKRGGVLNIVRHSIELIGQPDKFPDSLEIDLTGLEINDSVHMSAIKLPKGLEPAITDRDFTIATVVAPSGLKRQMSEEGGEEGEEAEEGGEE